jgi:hypothetical protein
MVQYTARGHLFIEYSEQPLQCSSGIVRFQFNVFGQDAPRVHYGANQRILIGSIHNEPTRKPKIKPRLANWFRRFTGLAALAWKDDIVVSFRFMLTYAEETSEADEAQ